TGSLLIVVVRRIHRRHLLPAACSFVAARSPCAGAHALRADPDLALRLRLQIHVPARMHRSAAPRTNDNVLTIHLLVEERQWPKLPALRSARDEKKRRQGTGSTANGGIPQVSPLGIRKIELDVVLDPLRHFRRRHLEFFFLAHNLLPSVTRLTLV